MEDSNRGGEFFPVLDVSRDAIDATTTQALVTGRAQAARVPGVIAPERLEQLRARLEAHDPPFLKTRFPDPFGCWFYGRPVDLIEDRSRYFLEAAEFRSLLTELAPDIDLEALVLTLAGRLLGRRVRVAPGPDGASYMPLTLRAHPADGYIPLHADREQLARPPCEHLRGLLDPTSVRAFTLLVDAPQAGGELVVHDLTYAQIEAAHIDDKGRSRLEAAVEGRAARSIPLDPGDFVLFNSGSFAHEVTPVRGGRKRWAAVGFVAASKQGPDLLCWG